MGNHGERGPGCCAVPDDIERQIDIDIVIGRGDKKTHMFIHKDSKSGSASLSKLKIEISWEWSGVTVRLLQVLFTLILTNPS